MPETGQQSAKRLKSFREARQLMDRLREISFPALWDDNDPWYSYKLISLYASMGEITLPGDYAQFGVYKGRCARFISSFLCSGRQLHLFDSFEGLPEDWFGPWRKGAFALSQDEIPIFDCDDIHVHIGWFRDTIPKTKTDLRSPLAFIHADADLYGSTMDILEGLNDCIAPGTIILFDEYALKNGDEYDDGEHRALLEWAASNKRKFDYLWRTQHCQVAIRITS
jgi:hypothetical protein